MPSRRGCLCAPTLRFPLLSCQPLGSRHLAAATAVPTEAHVSPAHRHLSAWPHCHLGTLPRGLCGRRDPIPLPSGGHSGSILLGSWLQPLAPASWGRSPGAKGGQGQDPSHVLCVFNQEPAVWLYLHAQGTRSLAAGPSSAPTKPSAIALPLQQYMYNSRERQRGREKERQRLCLHAPVQSSLLMRRIWLLVSRGVCPVG